MIVIDEQHKFGVKQRMSLSKKGTGDLDVLLMSATPIPRTLMMTLYGDMDVSRLIEKPSNRKPVISVTKPEIKINEIIEIEKVIKKLVKNKHYNFLETLAEDVFDELFKDERIDKIKLKIEKLDAIRDAASVGIEITKKRIHV